MGAPVAVGQYRDAAQRRVDVDARVVVVDLV
jgi:hypothetical protein